MVTVNDVGKLALLAIAMVGAIVLLALGAISETAGVGVLMAIVGYLTGNGALAVRRRRPSPAIGPREDPGP